MKSNPVNVSKKLTLKLTFHYTYTCHSHFFPFDVKVIFTVIGEETKVIFCALQVEKRGPWLNPDSILPQPILYRNEVVI